MNWGEWKPRLNVKRMREYKEIAGKMSAKNKRSITTPTVLESRFYYKVTAEGIR
jgi:hypothetical protein